MIRKNVTVLNEAGLHARPSAALVKLASKFDCDFAIQMQGYKVNGKSILGVMTLAAEQGAKLELITDGPDEDQAMDEIADLFQTKFDIEK